MIPGIEVMMAGEKWQVPPLTLGQLRRLMPKLRQLTEINVSMGEDQIIIVAEIVAEAMRRNYPDLTAEKVEDLLDLGNAQEVLAAIMTGSGLKPRGETIAVATLNGAGSMGSSPLPADIPTQ